MQTRREVARLLEARRVEAERRADELQVGRPSTTTAPPRREGGREGISQPPPWAMVNHDDGGMACAAAGEQAAVSAGKARLLEQYEAREVEMKEALAEAARTRAELEKAQR